MATICENVDCPICMDVIEGNNNRVTTECGHCFHTSCLMTSVAHNGFGCPYCRSKMAEEQEEDEDDEESEYDDEESEYDDEEQYYDYALSPLEITNIVSKGPNTTLIGNASQALGVRDPNYLSLRWFFYGTTDSYNP